MNKKKLNVVIIGATGYIGSELTRILAIHPRVKIVAITSEKSEGRQLSKIFPIFKQYEIPRLSSSKDINWKKIDIAYFCLPHGKAQKLISKAYKVEKLKIIDLSADFRIKSLSSYKKWYGETHKFPVGLKKSVYGLTEIYGRSIRNSKIIACPGCYPTSILIPILPLINKRLVDIDTLIVDSKSGISGAGRSAVESNLFSEINEGMKAYNVGFHRHMAELDQELGKFSKKVIKTRFTTHLVPMSRGILSTIYLKLKKNITINLVYKQLNLIFKDSFFVKISPLNQVPSTNDVRGTNFIHIGVSSTRNKNEIIIVSVIDNLIKGGAGQAVQNMNLVYGFPENTGLNLTPSFP